MAEQITDRARRVREFACQEAWRYGDEYLGTVHLLAGLTIEKGSVAALVLKDLGVELCDIRKQLDKLVYVRGSTSKHPLLETPRARKVMADALDEARRLRHSYVGTEHILLGLLKDHDGLTEQIFLNLGLNVDLVREAVVNRIGFGIEEADQAMPANPTVGDERLTQRVLRFLKDLVGLPN